MTIPNVLLQSESQEWYTPLKYIVAVREVFGELTLDPASSDEANKVVQAKHFYTTEDDGLHQDWFGNVFLNPPCGRYNDPSSAFHNRSNQELWTSKAIDEWRYRGVLQAILLVNARTSEKWFQPLWEFPICFTDHRIKFYNIYGESSSPTHGNAFVYLPVKDAQEMMTERCFSYFRYFGHCVKPSVR